MQKGIHATVTITLVMPENHVPEGLTLPDLAFRASTGLVALESIHYKARKATKEETARHADFLADWSLNLEAYATAVDNGRLTAVDAAADHARRLTATKPNEDPIVVAHWPGQSLPVCRVHLAQMELVGDALGIQVPTSPADPRTSCFHCSKITNKAMHHEETTTDSD